MNEIRFQANGDELLTNRDLQTILHIGKNKAYELQKSACFPTIKINNRLYVTRRSLTKWLEEYSGREYKI